MVDRIAGFIDKRNIAECVLKELHVCFMETITFFVTDMIYEMKVMSPRLILYAILVSDGAPYQEENSDAYDK